MPLMTLRILRSLLNRTFCHQEQYNASLMRGDPTSSMHIFVMIYTSDGRLYGLRG